MSTFPLDVLGEILCRLPVDNLLRLRCVLKSWCALIDSPEFAKLHLNHSLKTNSNRCVLLRQSEYFGYNKCCFYCLDIDSLNSRLVTPKELRNPLSCCDFETNILGSCNGLLLISKTADDIALWNPSTRKFNKLPVIGISQNNGHVKFGLGYDTLNDDYKVVRIMQFSGSGNGSFRSDVKIYSLRSNSWKGVEEFPYYILYGNQPGTYLNGALHWVASTEMETTHGNSLIPIIVAFDLGTEECRVVPHPPYTNKCSVVNLVVMGGSLCTYLSYFIDSCDDWGNVNLVVDHVDIWEMKKYGVKGSWTMVTSLQEPDKDTCNSVIPLAYSKSGEEVLVEQDNTRFLWISIKEHFVKIVDPEIGSLYYNSYVYLGSLVQLSSSDDRSDMKKQDNQYKGGKRKALKKRGDDFLSKGFKLKL